MYDWGTNGLRNAGLMEYHVDIMTSIKLPIDGVVGELIMGYWWDIHNQWIKLGINPLVIKHGWCHPLHSMMEVLGPRGSDQMGDLTTSLFSRSLESWFLGKSSPWLTQLFRLVNYDHLPRYLKMFLKEFLGPIHCVHHSFLRIWIPKWGSIHLTLISVQSKMVKLEVPTAGCSWGSNCL